MVPGKVLIAGILLITVMAGCSKKKEALDKTTPTTTPVTTTPAASQDIFDEFYKEDTAARKAPEPQPVQREQPARSYEAPEFDENGRFVVQVSTVRSRALADDIASKLSAKGYPAYVAEVESPTPALPGTYYRIRIGGFNRVSKARSFGENILSAEGYEYWVDNRSNDNVGLQGGGMGGGDTYYSSQPAQTYQPEPSAYPSSSNNTYAPATPSNTYPPPAQEYTPESATQEFNATPAPAPATPAAPATQPSTTPEEQNSEWGNEGW